MMKKIFISIKISMEAVLKYHNLIVSMKNQCLTFTILRKTYSRVKNKTLMKILIEKIIEK